jgi:hypothetical protein
MDEAQSLTASLAQLPLGAGGAQPAEPLVAEVAAPRRVARAVSRTAAERMDVEAAREWGWGWGWALARPVGAPLAEELSASAEPQTELVSESLQ